MELINDAMRGIGVTLSDLIQRILALADNKDTPHNLRDSIYKDLIDMAREASEKTPDAVLRLTSGRKMLKPSRDKLITDEEKNNEDR